MIVSCAGEHDEKCNWDAAEVLQYPGPVVVCLSSLSLVARAVRESLEQRAATVLTQREVAWKAWYAGRQTAHLVKADDATVTIRGQRYVLGACKTPRERHPSDGRARDMSLHWHTIY